MAAVDLSGSYKCDRSENFDKFFDYMGKNVNFVLRQVVKLAKSSKPSVKITQTDTETIIDMNMGFKTQRQEIKTDGKPFEKDDHGHKFQVTAYYEGNKLVAVQVPLEKGNWKKTVTTREIVDDELYLEMTVGEEDDPEKFVCKRWFKRDVAAN